MELEQTKSSMNILLYLLLYIYYYIYTIKRNILLFVKRYKY